MTNLFLAAARGKFRFASNKGLLTVEQLFDLPLTGATSLNSVAQTINADVKATGEESFVPDARQTVGQREATLKLEVVKEVIAIKVAERDAEATRRARREERDKLLNAIEAAETRELSTADVATLRQKLAALEDA